MEEYTQETMQEESRKYDFTSLSERISAQTEAYIGFSNALVKIIEQTANIRDFSIQIKDLLDEEYRELNDGFQKILLEVTKYHSDSNNQHNLLNKDIEVIKSKLSGVETKIEILIKDNTSHHDGVGRTSSEIYNYAKEIANQISLFKEEHQKSNKTISDYIITQDINLKNIQKAYERIKYFLWALGVMITLYTVLSSFHILSLTWFGNTASK